VGEASAAEDAVGKASARGGIAGGGRCEPEDVADGGRGG
jgi:hypothetical protein